MSASTEDMSQPLRNHEVAQHPPVQEHGGSDDDDEGHSDYGPEHLAVVLKPVALTMALACAAVNYFRDPEEDANISRGLSVYMVFDENSDEGDGEKLGKSLINALVIIGVIVVMTFILVLCYKYRCLKVMLGYLVAVSALLLGYSGGFMFHTAITVYEIQIDWLTFVFIMFNFAGAGVVAIFWQKGLPRIITQGYLVMVSIIMAWIVTKLPEYTSWTLLVLLALYDLCAVLTPCGPLRKLIELAQVQRDPIPGLLYEAEVNTDRRRGDTERVRGTFISETRRHGQQASQGEQGGRARTSDTRGTQEARGAEGTRSPPKDAEARQARGTEQSESPGSEEEHTNPAHGMSSEQESPNKGTDPSAGDAATPPADDDTNVSEEKDHVSGHVLVNISVPPRSNDGSIGERDWREGPSVHEKALSESGTHLTSSSPTAPPTPSNTHATTATSQRSSNPTMQQRQRHHHHHHQQQQQQQQHHHEDEDDDRSIKLGLGDFVFYSMLVSRAALFGLPTMAACYVSIIMGLGGTLFMLSIFQKALPALPVSIFLGVIFYLITRVTVVPYIIEHSLTLSVI